MMPPRRLGSGLLNYTRMIPYEYCVMLQFIQFTSTIISLDNIIAQRYHSIVIVSFESKETEKIFLGQISKKLPLEIQRTARRKLLYLDGAKDLQDLQTPPGIKLEILKGDRAGQYSIRINDQWRICFEWLDNKARKVEIVDHHS